MFWVKAFKICNVFFFYFTDAVSIIKVSLYDKYEFNFQLICQNILNGINMEFREGLCSVVMNFVAIHVVHRKAEPRLRNFASLTRVWPDCCERIIEFQQKSPQFCLITDQEMVSLPLSVYIFFKE